MVTITGISQPLALYLESLKTCKPVQAQMILCLEIQVYLYLCFLVYRNATCHKRGLLKVPLPSINILRPCLVHLPSNATTNV